MSFDLFITQKLSRGEIRVANFTPPSLEWCSYLLFFYIKLFIAKQVCIKEIFIMF